mgnify:CR=1 FL=1
MQGRSGEKDDDDDEEDDADGDKVKKIILDEDGFWKPMVDALKVKIPSYGPAP